VDSWRSEGYRDFIAGGAIVLEAVEEACEEGEDGDNYTDDDSCWRFA